MQGTALPPTLTVDPAEGLHGELTLPGDKSISHRALMFALLADGTSRITGASDGAHVRSTAGIAQALGAEIECLPQTDGGVDYVVSSGGMDWLMSPASTLDCGNSGTSLRLYAGILAGQPFEAVLDGDDSLRSRPMDRVIEPLRAMGASLTPADGNRAPLRIGGGDPLHGIDWQSPVASAQVKSAVLLAGLRADGVTTVREAVTTRDHTERMLLERGVNVRRTSEGLGQVVRVAGGAHLNAVDQVVPGDISAAAFWLVAGTIHPSAEIRLRNVGVNPTRRAVIDILRRMGADIEELPSNAAASSAEPGGEPTADLVVRSARLEAIELSPEDTAAAIDEIPIICLAATQAAGRTVIRGAGELRHKESDRIAGTVAGLHRMHGMAGVQDGNDLVLGTSGRLQGATVESRGDHRLAMTFAIAALGAKGSTTILGAESVAISYPTFFADLERIRS